MYERHKRRYSLCDISKVDRTVDVVLLKVRRGHTSYSLKISGRFLLYPYCQVLVLPKLGWSVRKPGLTVTEDQEGRISKFFKGMSEERPCVFV